MKDGIVIITGANKGIGKEAAKQIAKLGAKVYMACRSVDSANQAKEEIIRESKNENVFVKEAKEYVLKKFPGNYGEVSPFHYPVTCKDAEKWLDEFLATRFIQFGIYEDAMLQKQNILFHSVLTPMLNIGLLQPQDIIDKAIEAAERYAVPINSLEGFIRQVSGWREFIRIVYEREGGKQRTKNYWNWSRRTH